MKSILYVGATLMIGASIYGFVDYRNTSRKKEFTRMYESPPEEKEPVVAAEKTVPLTTETAPVAVTDKKVMLKEKSVAMKSKVAITVAEKIESAPVLVTTPVKETASARKFKQVKKKRLDYKLFSRARPPREIIELPEPVKTETKKEEIKEQ